jgi:hypothetical protein
VVEVMPALLPLEALVLPTQVVVVALQEEL